MVEIVYWSGTGNTEAMANEIEAAVKAAGADVESVRFEDTNVDDVASKDVILLGCPAMGSEELEDSVVEPFFTDLAPKLKGKKVGLFGSYGWGSGEWMDAWKQRTEDAGVVGRPEHRDSGTPQRRRQVHDSGVVRNLEPE